MENIDEDIKIVEKFIDGFRAINNNGELVGGFCDGSTYVRENTFQAIENLLSRLKTAERMNDVLIEVVCNNTVPKDECKDCIKEWARKKVEDG